MTKDFTSVLYLNLTSIHSWRSVIGGSEINIGGVLGLYTSGDHAPANETNDPYERTGKNEGAPENEIDGFEL